MSTWQLVADDARAHVLELLADPLQPWHLGRAARTERAAHSLSRRTLAKLRVRHLLVSTLLQANGLFATGDALSRMTQLHIRMSLPRMASALLDILQSSALQNVTSFGVSCSHIEPVDARRLGRALGTLPLSRLQALDFSWTGRGDELLDLSLIHI